MTKAWELNVGPCNGEDELDIVEEDMHEGEASERGGRESHREEGSPRSGGFIPFCRPAMSELCIFRSERNDFQSSAGRTHAVRPE